MGLTKERVEELRNYVRLNAKSIYDIHDLYAEMYYELFELVVDIPDFKKWNVQLSKVCNYHNAPIGQKTNWGGRDKTYHTDRPGWYFANIHGTIRDKHGNNPSRKHIANIDKNVLGGFTFGDFNSIRSLDYQHGINTGSFNGGWSFMGCFYIFVEDFPLLINNLTDWYEYDKISDVFGVDYNTYLRGSKIRRLKERIAQ